MQQLQRENKSYPYHYFSNGLFIFSEIYLPELPVYEPAQAIGTSIRISWGTVPENLEQVTFRRAICQISETEFLLDIKNIARYLVKGNNEVIVQPCPGASEDVIRLYILSTILGVLLHKNDILSLHASAININGNALLMAGNSGAGKSTLAFGLYQRGYEVFNDDISSIYFNDEKSPYVFPGSIHLKLWAEAIEKYGHKTDDLRKLRNGLEKYSYPVQRTNANGIPLKAIFFLSSRREDKMRCETVEGLKAFHKLHKHTFRHKLLKGLKKEVPHFMACNEIIKTVPLFIFYRPRNAPPGSFADYVEKQIRQL